MTSRACQHYQYLGTPINLPCTTLRGTVHFLSNHIKERIKPLKWITNRCAGVSVPIDKTIYTAYIRSHSDYRCANYQPLSCHLEKSCIIRSVKSQQASQRTQSSSTPTVHYRKQVHQAALDVAYSRMTYVIEPMHRLPDWVNTTTCELQGILRAINYLMGEYHSGLVIRDSCSGVDLKREKTDTFLIHFMWIPSYIGLHKQNLPALPIPDNASFITTGRVKTPLKKAALQIINEERSE
ncbi:hypothetical protein Hamer_G003033, partial [Homarus americanus]